MDLTPLAEDSLPSQAVRSVSLLAPDANSGTLEVPEFVGTPNVFQSRGFIDASSNILVYIS